MDDNDDDNVNSEELKENDLDEKVKILTELCSSLKKQNVDSAREFDIQRAKFKKFLLQKEDELSKVVNSENLLKTKIASLESEIIELRSKATIVELDYQSRLEKETRILKEELSTHQCLLSGTLDEARHLSEENEQLRSIISQYELQLKSDNISTDLPSVLLAPSAVFSTLARNARKVTSQLSGSVPANMEGNMRKAKEEADILKSVVVPLEEEIKSLKAEIKVKDEALLDLQTKQNVSPESSDKLHISHSSSVETDTFDTVERSPNDSSEINSSMIINMQQKIHDLEMYISTLERYKHDLLREMEFRKQTEEEWNVKREQFRLIKDEIGDKVDRIEETFVLAKNVAATITSDSIVYLNKLREENYYYKDEIKKLKSQLEYFIYNFNESARGLEEEIINLSDDPNELQELLLQRTEELINTKRCVERCQRETDGLKKQLNKNNNNQVALLKNVSEMGEQISSLEKNIAKQQGEVRCLQYNRDAFENQVKELETKLKLCDEEKKKLEESISEFRGKITSLQVELANGELVQKDFVLLSQSLQKELERFRCDGTQVRWEHDEDVQECPNCKLTFSVAKKKQHCRHCGRIFCSSCLDHEVKSGPNNRPSKVCDVCHTLLEKDTAPYFCVGPPIQTP